MARGGMPYGWNERFKNNDFTLPDGAEFFVTLSHGYLRVDTRIWPAEVTSFDYYDGPHHVLLEEDCSAPKWVADWESGKFSTGYDLVEGSSY